MGKSQLCEWNMKKVMEHAEIKYKSNLKLSGLASLSVKALYYEGILITMTTTVYKRHTKLAMLTYLNAPISLLMLINTSKTKSITGKIYSMLYSKPV